MSVGGHRFTGFAVAVALALAIPASAQALTIDFEDRTAGEAVNVQYASQGVTFDNATALAFSPGFAHSGTKAVEPCYAIELCQGALRADFTTGQTNVGAWVGFDGTQTPALTVRLTAYDAPTSGGNVVGTSTANIPASGTSTPITTHLSVTVANPTIRRLEIGVPNGGFNNGLAIDDVELSTAGPPPPCSATAPPTVMLDQPPGFTTYHLNQFPLAGSVDSHGAPLTGATIEAKSEMSGPRVGNLFPALIRPEGGNFGPVRLNGFLYAPNPDLHDITVSATNCKGTGTSNERRVFWAPLPSTTRFVQAGPIEVTQSVQTTLNSVPLVAGGASGIKRTFARAYLSVEGGAPEVRHMTGTLTATLPDGSPAPGPLRAHSINPAPAFGFAFPPDQLEDERSRLQDPLLFELPPEWVAAGRIHLQLEHVYIEGEESHFPCEGCENIGPIGFPPVPGPAQVRFHEVPPLRVWLVGMPYRTSPNGTPLTPSQMEFDSVASLLRRMYPTADVQVNQATLPIAGSPPATCKEAKNRVAQWGQSIASQDSRVRVLGLLESDPDVTVTDGDGNVIGGCAERPGQFGWVFADDEIGAAHELGHTFGRKHVAGCQLFEGYGVDTDYPHPFGLIGDAVLGDAVGFDAGDSAVLAPMAVHDWRKGVADVMSYCSKKWLSDYNYGLILGALCDADEANCPDRAAITGHSRRRDGAQPAATVARRGTRGPRLSVLGSVSADGKRASLDSLAVLDRGALSTRGKHGRYAIVLRGGDGRVLGRFAFTPTDIGEDVRNSIDEMVPFKRGTRRIEITAGGHRLAAARVSAHAPSVRVTAPNGGGKLGKRATVRWRSADADGGRRTYTVLYSPGGGRSIPIASDVHKRSLRVGLKRLPGGRHARFVVVANDGVLTGRDASRPFKVKAKKPDVSISTPASGTELGTDQTVQLVASVSDLQDVRFAGRRVVWRSSLQGKLGRGKAITATLSAGTHEITATATNSAGKKRNARTTVTVSAPPPLFTIAP